MEKNDRSCLLFSMNCLIIGTITMDYGTTPIKLIIIRKRRDTIMNETKTFNFMVGSLESEIQVTIT